jgi:hypothetical protein
VLVFLGVVVLFCGSGGVLSGFGWVVGLVLGGGWGGGVWVGFQERFMAIAKGRAPDPYGWLTPLPAAVAAGA